MANDSATYAENERAAKARSAAMIEAAKGVVTDAMVDAAIAADSVVWYDANHRDGVRVMLAAALASEGAEPSEAAIGAALNAVPPRAVSAPEPTHEYEARWMRARLRAAYAVDFPAASRPEARDEVNPTLPTWPQPAIVVPPETPQEGGAT